MKILLVGEFSRLHNSLKEGLTELGHEVKIVGCGDNFKNYPVDFSTTPTITSNTFFFRFINKITTKLFRLNIENIERSFRFYCLLPKLKNYDLIQLINSDAVKTFPAWEIKLYKKLFSQNQKSFLLICGEETPVVKVLLQNKLRYSILTPYFKNPKLKGYFNYTLKYVSKKHTQLYDFIISNCNGCIASDLDYKIPMEQTQTPFTFIPNPVNSKKIKYINNPIGDKIVLFHGINSQSSIKKGSHFFEIALEKIAQKYPEKVEIIIVNSLPYEEYGKILNRAHIVLDQVYSFDQGYNALEAMAKGKVVFTGAEKEFLDYYGLQEDEVAINALPDVDYLVKKLSFLIENQQEITAIGKRARAFIEREHDYVTIATKYLKVWT
ncbi:MAG: glycosyltransferase [Flavobacterium sp.]